MLKVEFRTGKLADYLGSCKARLRLKPLVAKARTISES